MFQFPLSVPRLILLSGAYLLKKLENNWGNLFQKVKKLLFLLANLICQLKILTYHSIMLTQIINAKILTPQGWLKDGSVLMRDNKILEVTNCDLAVIGAELIDAKGMYVVPGGVEIHCHGGGGGDFMEGTAHGGAQAVHREEFVLRIFCAQVLEGDARGVECAGQPGRKTHIQHVEAVPRHFTRHFPECLHIDLAGGGHSPAAEHIVKVPGRKVCFLRVVPIAFFADGIGHGQYSNARLRHKLRRKVRGGIRQDLIFTHRCRKVKSLRNYRKKHYKKC